MLTVGAKRVLVRARVVGVTVWLFVVFILGAKVVVVRVAVVGVAI